MNIFPCIFYFKNIKIPNKIIIKIDLSYTYIPIS
jgi:hypothetical protein